MDVRVGIGHDIHALVPNRQCWLGGVLVPFNKGLLGHSDADVLLHSVIDALLGALSLGDIGQHFPDTDPAYKGISSGVLLEKVMDLVEDQGYRVGNLDCCILCEQPKIGSYRDTIQKSIAKLLRVALGDVSVKAGTNEGFDAVGKGEAISCQAVVLLHKSS